MVDFGNKLNQIFSQSGKEDSSWSVHITNDEVTLYKGDDYDTRDQEFDENYLFPASLSHSGIEDLSFTKIEGLPSTTGEIYLQDSIDNILSISVNSKGLVDY